MPNTTNTHDWTLPGSDRQLIHGTVHQPARPPRGVLLICHGFKGYKDYGLLPHLAEAAAQQGLIAHRFNFSHSGMTPNIATFERPELFEQDTWRKQVHDLRAVAQAVQTGKLSGEGLPTVWFGHSRGGVTALLAAAGFLREATQPHPGPAGVVTAAAPHEACHFDEDQRAQLRQAGRLASPSSRTGQTLHVGCNWLAEIEAEPAAHDPLRAAASLDCPLLIVHGSEDPTVDVGSAHKLAEAAGGRAMLRVIEGASHTFDAPNPLPLDTTPPPATRQLIDWTCRFALDCCARHE